MSRENVEVVRRLFDAIHRRDYESASGLLHEEVTWQPFFTVESHLHVGKDAVREGWERNVEAMDARPEADEYIPVGDDRVVVRLRFLALGTTSGLALEAPAGQIYTVRQGKIARLETYRSHEEALETVGLRQ